MVKDFNLMKKIYTAQRMDELEQTVKRFGQMEEQMVMLNSKVRSCATKDDHE